MMKKNICLFLLLISFNTKASFNERAEFRNDLSSALDSLDINYVEATPQKSSWYIKNIWVEFSSFASFSVPGLAGLKVTPTFRIYLKRALRDDDQDYKP